MYLVVSSPQAADECGIIKKRRPHIKPLFHSSQKPAGKLAASAFKYCDWMKVLTQRACELAFAMSGKEL